jgi:predicted kinase
MKQVIICVGISGSCKSSWATNLIRENSNFLRCNRDDIRETLVGTLDGYYQREDFNALEGIVNQLELNFATRLVTAGKSIILDNTHLVQKYITRWINLFETDNFFNHRGYKITFKLFECDLETAQSRVMSRDFGDGSYGLENVNYIDKQFKQYQEIKQWLLENYKDDII